MITINTKLLSLLQEISYDYESQRYLYLAIHSALKTYYAQCQYANSTRDAYMESFNNLQEVVVHCKGEIGQNLLLILYEIRQDNRNFG